MPLESDWSPLLAGRSNVASFEQPIASDLDHDLCVVSVVPDRKTLLEHLFDAVLSFVLVVPPESWC